jgi:hypothetical protein
MDTVEGLALEQRIYDLVAGYDDDICLRALGSALFEHAMRMRSGNRDEVAYLFELLAKEAANIGSAKPH